MTKKECNNYRGIALVNVNYKIISYCILDRVKPLAKEIIGDCQNVFKRNKSTIDQIFIIRQIFQNTWEFNKELHALIMDFKKANNSINRESIYNILEQICFPQKLISNKNEFKKDYG